MGSGVNGSDIVEWIRESHSIYRPIIFYSAGSTLTDESALKDLNEAAENARMLGKNFMTTPRSRLSALLSDIAKEMHREEHKVNQVRGLLMDQVGEIDAKVIKSIDTLWLEVPIKTQPKVQKELNDRLFDKLKKACSLYKLLRRMKYEQVAELLVANVTNIDAFARAKVLREMLRAIPKFAENGKVLSPLCNDKGGLMDLRNDYAHKSIEEIEGHDDKRFKFIREESRKHNLNLDNVLRVDK